ncbi:hypothetical protein [Phenylobacterium sp.]|nr:hypothetical protein [Phenylobacterium sp.]HVI33799.1 hypothetical protein [Phenylobacterium sp.]
MRPLIVLIVTLAALALTAIVWVVSDGRAFVFILPLLFGLPFLWRRRG